MTTYAKRHDATGKKRRDQERKKRFASAWQKQKDEVIIEEA